MPKMLIKAIILLLLTQHMICYTYGEMDEGKPAHPSLYYTGWLIFIFIIICVLCISCSACCGSSGSGSSGLSNYVIIKV